MKSRNKNATQIIKHLGISKEKGSALNSYTKSSNEMEIIQDLAKQQQKIVGQNSPIIVSETNYYRF